MPDATTTAVIDNMASTTIDLMGNAIPLLTWIIGIAIAFIMLGKILSTIKSIMKNL